MKFKWNDYNPIYHSFVEDWLDDEARKHTGIDDSWNNYFTYWMKNTDESKGEFFICKVIYSNSMPIAVIGVGIHNKTATVSEIIVSPAMRNKGFGGEILREFLESFEDIFDMMFLNAVAVLYPDNIASQKAFLKAGFCFEHAHPDGDVWYYSYKV